MNQQAVNPSASQSNADSQASLSSNFLGFEPLSSNYVYCPNQFLDICLKSNSRGMVRIVAYILRQTLGWLDENGEPVHQTVKVSYQDLIKKAGVSRGAIADALQRAVAMGFLDCITEGRPKQKSQSSQTAEYTLRWDHRSTYAKSFEMFQGFFVGEGHRTPVPNAFFDHVIPSEKLSVTKVVGTVIRHTVGYQNQFGGRRMVSPLSCTFIQNCTLLKKRNDVVDALRHAEQVGYIHKVETGKFSPIASEQSASVYAIKWLSKAEKTSIGSEKLTAAYRNKKVTSNGIKQLPDNQFKKVNSIEKTKTKDIFKQQAVAQNDSLIQALIDAGFSRDTAAQLVSERGVECVSRQLQWIDARKPKNRAAMLRKAIEGDWEEPESFKEKRKRSAKRDYLVRETEKLRAEDRKAAEIKKARLNRKKRLLNIWKQASREDRLRWIVAAANRQSGEMLRNIIRKQTPETKSPNFQVLDELAFDCGLPPVSDVTSAETEFRLKPVSSPQKENSEHIAEPVR